MKIFNKLRLRSNTPATTDSPVLASQEIKPEWDDGGAIFAMPARTESLSYPDKQRLAYLQQLEEEGFVTALPDSCLLEWEALFALLESEEHASSLELLDLPEISGIRPRLLSEGALSDPAFKILIKGWQLPDGTILPGALKRNGARFSHAGQDYLLSRAAWQLCTSVRDFSQEQLQHPGSKTNQLGWAKIRRQALACNADMDGFLRQTIVLNPDKLNIELQKHIVNDTPVLEVKPGFDGQPAGWLRSFDAYDEVQSTYHITADDGSISHVLVTPEARTVLEAIRRMPGRRVAGDDALMLVRNPHAVLGDDAIKVIDPDSYERALEKAGVCFHRFSLLPVLATDNRISHVDLLLEPNREGAPSETCCFEEAAQLARFVQELESKLQKGLPCGFWQGFELNLADLQPGHVTGIKQLLDRWQQEVLGQWFGELLDPAAYGDRVVGIGVKEKVSSPFLVKEKGENWLPADLLQQCGLDAELLNRWDSASREDYDEFVERIARAEAENAERVNLPKLEISLTLPFAKHLQEAWGKKFAEPATGGGSSETNQQLGLQVDSNIDEAPDELGAVTAGELAQAILPDSLQDDISLHAHQLEGVAWLQDLFSRSPKPVTGALLADDMGLGKTLQLLTFIAWYLEQGAVSGPVMIVAPVSLLDNWEREFKRFFHTRHMPVLRLYGETLSAVKLSKHEIPADLQVRGICNLLRPGWQDGAAIVLTTYETLRSQELSLARLSWGIMVCDEAQKIKNPAALVTQSAKAVPARFRVACTGTPVENSLTDLWCLFDFIQPGKLGALNAFGQRYRRPIECDDVRSLAALEELRSLIAPQILRRTKEQVASLPPKLEYQPCRQLPISTLQDVLYRSEIQAFQQKGALLQKAGDRNIAVLGLLHTLRMICAHPHAIRPEGELLQVSPKMRWLLEQLDTIRQSGEKAIIFTEFRDLQREIKLALMERFGLRDVIIVNGDTKASTTRGDSRQSLIDRFQEQDGFGVIILSTTAVGFGVNVQAANHVIHFTRPWNPAKEDQATDRAYRIGQCRTVHVYYPTITSDNYPTFETKLDSLLERKRELSKEMLNGSGDVGVEELLGLA